MVFFNPKNDPDNNQKPTFKKRKNPDPDRLPKINPAWLPDYLEVRFFFTSTSLPTSSRLQSVAVWCAHYRRRLNSNRRT
jgi:hypothetical protein